MCNRGGAHTRASTACIAQRLLQCKVNCLIQNLENAARESVRMYNEALEEAWWDEEAKAMVDGDNTIEFDTWEPDPKLLVYPPLLDKVITIIEEYSSDCLISPDMHEDEKYIDGDDLVDRMHASSYRCTNRSIRLSSRSCSSQRVALCTLGTLRSPRRLLKE